MPLIQHTGRKTVAARATYAVLYLLLSLGALSILYPLALMVRRSVSSYVEVNEKGIFPRYLYDDAQLFRKYIALKYHHRFPREIGKYFGLRIDDFSAIRIPDVNPNLNRQWAAYAVSVPTSSKQALFMDWRSRKLPGRTHLFFQQYALEKYGSVEGIRQAYGYPVLPSLRGLHAPREAYADRDWYPYEEPRLHDWYSFKAGLSEEYLTCPRTEVKWANYIRDRYRNSLSMYNTLNGTAIKDFTVLSLPLACPDHPVAAADWEVFVREKLAYRFILFRPEAVDDYRDYLLEKYRNIRSYNRVHATDHASFAAVELPGNVTMPGLDIHELTEFIQIVPREKLVLRTTENDFRNYLTVRFRDLAGINAALHTSYGTLTDIKPPWLAMDWEYLKKARGYWQRHFLLRNYEEVFKRIYSDGHVLKTTVIYLAGVILLQLLVNTLAAYALSRFRLSYAYKVLLFFLVTMAFPAEITLIPVFIMMQKMHLLNTFAALILPTAVNAYFLFVLKGFFDNLPRYCYEAAELDDVNELSIFWNITLPMSHPAIAWLVLQSFSLAYSSFLFLMIVAQQRHMWTLMVFIYEMQNWAPPFLIMAAITVAAIPGVAVFLVCQRFIMRGMGLPLEH